MARENLQLFHRAAEVVAGAEFQSLCRWTGCTFRISQHKAVSALM